MDTFKQLMGFVLLGTVIFLMTSLKQSLLLPTLAVLFAVWFGCWWIGRIPISANLGRKLVGWVAATTVAIGLAFGSYLLLGPHKSYVKWQQYDPVALARAAQEGKTVMLEFTANWCATCKINMRWAIDTQRVGSYLEQNGIVPMLADWTDRSDDIKAALESLGAQSIPMLAIFPAHAPDKPILLPDVLTEGTVLEALKEASPSLPVGGSSALELTQDDRTQQSSAQLIQSRRLPLDPEPAL